MTDSAKQPQATRSSEKVGVNAYRSDVLYPRVVRVVALLLARGSVVAPVDVLLGMDLLTPAKLEDWRFGRVPYLEKVIAGNLAKLARLLRILRHHARELNLRPSTTAYMRWGKGPKQRLRFSKTGDCNMEAAYSLHFVRSGKAERGGPPKDDASSRVPAGGPASKGARGRRPKDDAQAMKS